MRVFAGLPIPGKMIEKIKSVCTYLKDTYRGIKTVKPEGIHVTLFFFGELPEKSVAELIRLMDDKSLKQPPIPASFNGFGQFPPRGNCKVLYIKINQGKDKIISYYDLYTELLQSYSFGKKPDKKFIPHITLSRNKRERFTDDFPGSIPFTLNDAFIIDRCVLYESVLSPAGAFYKPLKTVLFHT